MSRSCAGFAFSVSVCIGFAASSVFAETTWYVDGGNCPGPGSGAIDDPYCTIQAGITASSDGDTVLVADGTYTGFGNRKLNFLGRAIRLRSAGGADRCVIDCQNQTRGFMFTSGEGADSVVEGFTITRGFGVTGGGGMLCFGSDPTVRDCVFVDNSGDVEFGGGMFNSDSHPTVIQCVFDGNLAAVGAGMANVNSSPVVVDCAFVGNLALGDFGGGMYNAGGAPVVEGCWFEGNRTAGGGGMGIGGNGGGMYNTNSSPTVTDCAFLDNVAQIGGIGRGGGVFMGGGVGTLTGCAFVGNQAEFGGGLAAVLTSPVLSHCSFTENAAIARGGGIHVGNGAPVFSECVFTRNAADRGGALHLATNSDASVDNSRFLGNGAETGGAIYNTSSSPTVTDSAFVGNHVVLDGSAVFNSGSSNPTFRNCSFSGQAVDLGGGVVHSGTGANATIGNGVLWGNAGVPLSGGAVVTFSDVSGGVSGDGNINADPEFLGRPDAGADGEWGTSDDDYGDLRLRETSPCVDAGDPAFVQADGDSDLQGHARVLCGRVDMGALESGFGDFDCDGVVDVFDLAARVMCVTGPGGGPLGEGCASFDDDGDGDVDWVDFRGFQVAASPGL